MEFIAHLIAEGKVNWRWCECWLWSGSWGGTWTVVYVAMQIHACVIPKPPDLHCSTDTM